MKAFENKIKKKEREVREGQRERNTETCGKVGVE